MIRSAAAAIVLDLIRLRLEGNELTQEFLFEYRKQFLEVPCQWAKGFLGATENDGEQNGQG